MPKEYQEYRFLKQQFFFTINCSLKFMWMLKFLYGTNDANRVHTLQVPKEGSPKNLSVNSS